jgi:PAS domain S-box-containing protein
VHFTQPCYSLAVMSISEDLGDDIVVSSAVLDAMPDAALLVAGDGTIVYANARADDLLGWQPADLVGRNVDALVPDSIAGRHASLRRRFVSDPRSRPMGNGLELDAVRRDGTEIAVEISLSPLRLGGNEFVIAAIRDGRPQRELRNALVDARDHVRSVIDALQDGILEFDIGADHYAMVNPRFCEMVGLSADEILATEGTPPWWDPAEVDNIKVLREQACSGVIARYELGLRHSDGHMFRVMVTSNATMRGDRMMLIGLFHDLTEEQRAAELLEASRSRVTLLEDRDRIGRDLHDGVIQRLFAAGLHLQAAIGRPDRDDRVLQVIDEIDDSIKQIRTTIFTLHGPRGLSTGLEHGLRVAVTEAGRLLGHDPTLHLRDGIETVGDDLGAEILTVVRELLTNIVKHASASASVIDLGIEDGALRLIVGDNGVGMNPDAIHAGSGMKNLGERAKQRGGSSRVTSNDDGGTTITWRVPLT